jgi:hypothetical protein
MPGEKHMATSEQSIQAVLQRAFIVQSENKGKKDNALGCTGKEKGERAFCFPGKQKPAPG